MRELVSERWQKKRREHEAGVAAIFFAFPAKLLHVGDILDGIYWEDRFYQAVYEVARDCVRSDGPKVPLVKVRTALIEKGYLVTESETATFNNLRRNGSTESDWHIAELLRLHTMEQQRKFLREAYEELQDVKADPNSVVEKLDTRLSAMRFDGGGHLWMTYREAIAAWQKDFQESGVEHHASDLKLGRNITTGYQTLDDLTGGMFTGQLWQIAARTFVGKTTFALNLASRIVDGNQNVGVYFASYEMSAVEIAERLIAMRTKTELDEVSRRGGDLLSDSLIGMVMNEGEDVKSLPLLIDENPPQTIQGIEARLSLAMIQHPIKVLIVDHLHEIPKVKGMERHEHLLELSKGFKRLAKKLGIVVLQLNQLNAEAGKKGEVPDDTQFAGSKEVLTTLDVSLLMHRVDKDAKIMDLILSKNRKGTVASVKANFLGATQRVLDEEDFGFSSLEDQLQ